MWEGSLVVVCFSVCGVRRVALWMVLRRVSCYPVLTLSLRVFLLITGLLTPEKPSLRLTNHVFLEP